jgi:membrane fusion protein (multidrug efflux system)
MNHGHGTLLERSPRNARRALRVARSREREFPHEEQTEAEAPSGLAPEAPEPPDAPQHTAPPDHSGGDGPHDGGEAKSPGILRRRPILVGLVAIALAAACGAGYVYWDYASHFESTDDAFIAARQFAIAPKVSGYIAEVPVTDNEHVVAGQVIARIDDRDYRTALEQAQAQLASAEANVSNVEAQTEVQKAQIAQNQAQVDQARAALTFAEQQAARYETLAKTGAGSIQNAQQYSSSLDQQRASLATSQAALLAAQRQVSALEAQQVSAEASVGQAKAQVDQAKLNLSYTVITAAQPGRVVQLGAGVGEFVAAGADLTMFVPDEIWVTANFKETQLDHMRPGQPTTLTIDSYPERTFRGHVASVQPGSGTAFSLLPAQNATGNYVKITQRVPVKIVIDDAPKDVALGPGMSVEPDVRVDPSPSIYERERARL